MLIKFNKVNSIYIHKMKVIKLKLFKPWFIIMVTDNRTSV